MYNKNHICPSKIFMMLLLVFFNFFFIKIPTIDIDNLQKNFRGEKGGKGEYLYMANFRKLKLEFEGAKRLYTMPLHLFMI